MAEYTEKITHHHFVNGETGEVEIHTITHLFKDGEPTDARRKHVIVIPPGAALDAHRTETVNIATAVWTPERIKAWDDRFLKQIADSRAMRQTEKEALEAMEREVKAAVQRMEDHRATFKAEVERYEEDLRAHQGEVEKVVNQRNEQKALIETHTLRLQKGRDLLAALQRETLVVDAGIAEAKSKGKG